MLNCEPLKAASEFDVVWCN